MAFPSNIKSIGSWESATFLKPGGEKTRLPRLCRKIRRYPTGSIQTTRRFGDWDHPYLTMSYDYEAITVAEFGKLYLAGSVYKGKKPVYWCASCKTALAEAEVEYDNHTTPSIYVKFPLVSDLAQVVPQLAGERVSFVIWTTTPWTIPANLAIAVHEDFIYAALKIDGETYIVARDLVDYCREAFGFRDRPYEILAEFPGKILEGQRARHPLYDRESVLILAPFVTLDAGTGWCTSPPATGRKIMKSAWNTGSITMPP